MYERRTTDESKMRKLIPIISLDIPQINPRVRQIRASFRYVRYSGKVNWIKKGKIPCMPFEFDPTRLRISDRFTRMAKPHHAVTGRTRQTRRSRCDSVLAVSHRGAI